MSETCGGSGAAVAVGGGVVVGRTVSRVSGISGVLVGGTDVTGSAVGTGPGGSTIFLTYKVYFSKRQETADFIAGICNTKIASRRNPASAVKMVLVRFDMRGSLSWESKTGNLLKKIVVGFWRWEMTF